MTNGGSHLLRFRLSFRGWRALHLFSNPKQKTACFGLGFPASPSTHSTGRILWTSLHVPTLWALLFPFCPWKSNTKEAQHLQSSPSAPCTRAAQETSDRPLCPASTRDGAPHTASLHTHVLRSTPTDIGSHQHRCGIWAAGAGSYQWWSPLAFSGQRFLPETQIKALGCKIIFFKKDQTRIFMFA